MRGEACGERARAGEGEDVCGVVGPEAPGEIDGKTGEGEREAGGGGEGEAGAAGGGVLAEHKDAGAGQGDFGGGGDAGAGDLLAAEEGAGGGGEAGDEVGAGGEVGAGVGFEAGGPREGEGAGADRGDVGGELDAGAFDPLADLEGAGFGGDVGDRGRAGVDVAAAGGEAGGDVAAAGGAGGGLGELAAAAPGGDQVACGVELGDRLVTEVADVEVAGAAGGVVDGEEGGLFEGAGRAASGAGEAGGGADVDAGAADVGAEGADEGAGGGELDDAVVFGVGDVDVAGGGVDGEAGAAAFSCSLAVVDDGGEGELAGAGAGGAEGVGEGVGGGGLGGRGQGEEGEEEEGGEGEGGEEEGFATMRGRTTAAGAEGGTAGGEEAGPAGRVLDASLCVTHCRSFHGAWCWRDALPRARMNRARGEGSRLGRGNRPGADREDPACGFGLENEDRPRAAGLFFGVPRFGTEEVEVEEPEDVFRFRVFVDLREDAEVARFSFGFFDAAAAPAGRRFAGLDEVTLNRGGERDVEGDRVSSLLAGGGSFVAHVKVAELAFTGGQGRGEAGLAVTDLLLRGGRAFNFDGDAAGFAFVAGTRGGGAEGDGFAVRPIRTVGPVGPVFAGSSSSARVTLRSRCPWGARFAGVFFGDFGDFLFLLAIQSRRRPGAADQGQHQGKDRDGEAGLAEGFFETSFEHRLVLLLAAGLPGRPDWVAW
jgi:hypothetical protein